MREIEAAIHEKHAGRPSPLLRTLFFSLVLAFAAESIVSAQGALYRQRSADLTRGDIDFFFESITEKDDRCEFKLSPNTMGMLWRIRGGKSDITGACKSGETLTVPTSASLEIKRKDVSLILLPRRPGYFEPRLTIKPDPSVSGQTESYSAFYLVAKSTGRFTLCFVED